MSETMSPNPAVAKAAAPRISEESATAQIENLYNSFGATIPLDKKGAWTGHAMKLRNACVRGRFEVDGTGDDVKVIQRLRRPVAGSGMLTWNWNKLGLGKMQIVVSQESGVKPYAQAYHVAAPMIGLDLQAILGMHPEDLSIVEDASGFFQNI